MKGLLAAVILTICANAAVAFAGDVYVQGYFKSDGTYVRPHIRSAPDSNLWNNYGPSQGNNQLLSPGSRDYDGDSVPNYLDFDDDNDGVSDDYDNNQYGGN